MSLQQQKGISRLQEGVELLSVQKTNTSDPWKEQEKRGISTRSEKIQVLVAGVLSFYFYFCPKKKHETVSLLFQNCKRSC